MIGLNFWYLDGPFSTPFQDPPVQHLLDAALCFSWKIIVLKVLCLCFPGPKLSLLPEFPAAPGYGYCYRLSSLIFDFHVLIRKGCPDPSELVYYDQISGWSAVLLRDFSL
jgi:hypothetical protein